MAINNQDPLLPENSSLPLDSMEEENNLVPKDTFPKSITPPISGLAESLNKDVQGALASLKNAQAERGITDKTQIQKFAVKGVRLGGKVIADELFNRSNIALSQAVRKLVANSGLTDQADQAYFAKELTTKLNKLQMNLVQRGIEFDKNIASKLSDAKAASALNSMWGQFAGMAVGGVIGGYATRSPQGAAIGSSMGGSIGSNLFSGPNSGAGSSSQTGYEGLIYS